MIAGWYTLFKIMAWGSIDIKMIDCIMKVTKLDICLKIVTEMVTLVFNDLLYS